MLELEIYTSGGDKIVLPFADKYQLNSVQTSISKIFTVLYNDYKRL